MSRILDKKLIESIPKDRIADFIFMHLRDMWSVDGLYYLNIEDKYGTEIATEIDSKTWEVMGKIEARKLKKFFNIDGKDIKSLIKALRFSSWVLDLENKEIIEKKDKTIIRNIKCRIQDTRSRNNLEEFGCKPVRFGFLKAFAYEFNPKIKVKCNICPPDKHPKDIWCEWEFSLN